MRLQFSLLVLLLATILTQGCSGEVAEKPALSSSRVSVTVSPKTANLVVGGSASFSASVSGTSAGQSTDVTWSVQEQGGGTVDRSGNYVAPAQSGTFHVLATSVAVPSAFDTATVVVDAAPVIAVAIVPSNASTLTG